MPTTEQLFTIWESQLEYFGGSGEPKQSFDVDENGLFSLSLTDSPISVSSINSNFHGELLGKLKLDREDEDFQIVFPSESKQSNT